MNRLLLLQLNPNEYVQRKNAFLPIRAPLSAFICGMSICMLCAEEPCLSSIDFDEGIDACACPSAYNAPAGIILKNPCDSNWPDFYISTSFLYYLVHEDGSDLANSALLKLNNSSSGYISTGTSNSESLFQRFEYQPGFKVGIGTEFCDWFIQAEYTWIRQTTRTHELAPIPQPEIGVGIWVLNNWYQQLTEANQLMSGSEIESKWHFEIDLADLTAGRPFYQGPNLKISPFLGLRAAWIRQTVDMTITAVPLAIASLDDPYVPSQNSSHSWALGPRIGLEADCLLGMGFRIEGDLAFSLLYTRYTTLKHTEKVASADADPQELQTVLPDISTLRPELDMGLGLGWGAYLCGQRYHIDFAASYDFIIFWEQNMIRKMMDQTVQGVGAAPAALSLRGLQVRGRFDF